VGHLHAGCSKEVTVTFHSNQPVTLSSQPMRCDVSRVEFQQPLEQVADWDDRQRTVRWLNPSAQASGAAPPQPVKNKVNLATADEMEGGKSLSFTITVELCTQDPEPCCSVVEGSHWVLELRISAVCDYVKFSCDTDAILFKDTPLYQTSLHRSVATYRKPTFTMRRPVRPLKGFLVY